MKQLVKKIKISTTIELLTGLHIGGSSENVEIGGIDNPVIKIATKHNQPYIPGSSLKGKIRCLLEQINGISEVGGGATRKNEEGKNVKYKFEDKPKECQKIINLFGFANDNKPSKLIVRDAMLNDASLKMLEECEELDMPYTENKWENRIDRVKGVASDPRQTERIPAGVSFDVEFVINIWDDDNAEDLVGLLKKGINALENDYLGGSGSRGYGQIKFGRWKYYEATETSEWKMEEVSDLISW